MYCIIFIPHTHIWHDQGLGADLFHFRAIFQSGWRHCGASSSPHHIQAWTPTGTGPNPTRCHFPKLSKVVYWHLCYNFLQILFTNPHFLLVQEIKNLHWKDEIFKKMKSNAKNETTLTSLSRPRDTIYTSDLHQGKPFRQLAFLLLVFLCVRYLASARY